MIGQLTARLVADVGDFNRDISDSRASVATVGTAAVKSQTQITAMTGSIGKTAMSVRKVSDEAIKVGQLSRELRKTATSIKAVNGEASHLQRLESSIEQTKKQVDAVSSAASDAQFNFMGLSRTLTAVSVASKPLALVGNNLGVVANTTSLAANGAAQVAAAFGLASTGATYLAAGLGIVLAPLRGLVIVPKLIGAAFGLMFAAILAPFKMVIGVVTLFAKGVWAAVQPVLALAKAIFNFKVIMSSIQVQLALLGKFLSILPPKVRAIVVGLVALGVAGKAGRFAITALNAGARILRIGLLSLTQPIRAVRLAITSAVQSFAAFSLATLRAARSLARFSVAKTVAGMRALGAATGNVAKSIGAKLVASFTSATKAAGALFALGTGWGVKLAADAEQAQVAFATMLKSGDAARAVLAELEQFAASTPFQLNDLQDGAKQLLNAQVPATDLTNRLRMLGDIAAGTGKPIIDFVRIFAKVKSTGKVSLETLNQLAERGVPIYSALQTELGKSRTEMLKMISKGQVGFAALDGALRSTAEGAGVFAGGMKAQSTTLSGLWSTLKDNLSFAMRELGVEVANAFNFKGMMTQGVSFFQALKDNIAAARPAFIATAQVVTAAFSSVYEVVSVVFGSIANALGITSGNWLQSFVEMAAVASWAFKEWPNIAQLAFTNLGMWIVQTGANFAHLFTGVMPALFSWFSKNWYNIFSIAAELVKTVFLNIARNIKRTMTSVWAFIASNGATPLRISWVPLMEGFKNTIEALPQIPPRAIGPLEAALKAESTRLGDALGSSLANEIAGNLEMLKKVKSEQAKLKVPKLGDLDIKSPDLQATGDDLKTDEADKGKSRNNFSVDAITKGSAEALKAVLAVGPKKDPQLDVQKGIKKGIDKLPASIASKLPKPVSLSVQGAVG